MHPELHGCDPGEGAKGFSIVETMVAAAIGLLLVTGVAAMLVQNSRINASQQMAVEVQSNARNTLAMVTAKLRSAGWNPADAAIPTVLPDGDVTDSFEEIEIFADLDGNADTDGPDEQILVRYDSINEVIAWRTSAAATTFTVLSVNISNDADDDGLKEPMFVLDDPSNPRRVTVQITARSPRIDPTSRKFLTYTVRSDVHLRSAR